MPVLKWITLRRLGLAWAAMLGLVLAAGAAQALTPTLTPAEVKAKMAAEAAAETAARASGEPNLSDSNAQRAKSQPGNNAPFWRAAHDSGVRPGISNLPGAEKGVLVQPFVAYPGTRWTNAGEAWRQVRNRWILPYGGALLFITALALALFYWRRGPLGAEHPNTGRQIERFTPFERAAHWCNAGAFVVLAVSGLTMAFGKFILLPLIGSTLFGWLTYVLKTAHNFVGPLFAVSLVVIIITFMKDNFPRAADLAWLAKAGGLLGQGHPPPSHRFNAGEKGVYWGGAIFAGLVVVSSGLVLDNLIPGYGIVRGEMQIAHLIHAVAAIFMMVVLLGHIYMGTIGTRGAFRAMRTGQVPEVWAQEHHGLWMDDIRAGKIPAQRSTQAEPALRPVGPQT